MEKEKVIVDIDRFNELTQIEKRFKGLMNEESEKYKVLIEHLKANHKLQCDVTFTLTENGSVNTDANIANDLNVCQTNNWNVNFIAKLEDYLNGQTTQLNESEKILRAKIQQYLKKQTFFDRITLLNLL